MPGKTHSDRCRVTFFDVRLNRGSELRTRLAAIAQGRVQPLFVIDLFEESLDRTRASNRSRYSLRNTSSYFKVFMNDSQAALSHGFPLRDMLIAMPCCFSRPVYWLLAYCEPRSE